MYTTSCFIRKNTPELLNYLEKIGRIVCTCCYNKNSKWLIATDGTAVHGIGAVGEDTPFKTIEESLDNFLKEYDKNKIIDCGTNEELFKSLVVLRDNSDESD